MVIMMEQLLTPEQVASVLQISHYKVRDMLRDKEIKGVKVGGQWRIRPADLQEYLQRIAATTEEEQQRDQSDKK